jgi:hypothetical protein
MKPRAEVDLALIINDPQKAREFIAGIDWRPDNMPESVNLGGDDIVFLNNLSDTDAVRTAKHLLKYYEIPKIQRDIHLYLPFH